MTWFLFAVGSLFGAPARYLLDSALSARRPEVAVPWGTVAVNVTGSFGLGLLAGLTSSGSLGYAALGTGFFGAFTTFSTFAWETFALVEDGAPRAAAVTVGANLVLGVLAAAAGFAAA